MPSVDWRMASQMFGQVGLSNNLLVAQYKGIFNDVFHLTDIAWEVVAHQDGKDFIGNVWLILFFYKKNISYLSNRAKKIA